MEMVSKRLKVDINDLGALADKGDWTKVNMNSYCSIFGIQDLVTSLAAGNTVEDVAAAACHSVAEQVYEQQLQEIDVRQPIIQVGGTSLISGLVKAVGDMVGSHPIIPPNSQYIGAAGAGLRAPEQRHMAPLPDTQAGKKRPRPRVGVKDLEAVPVDDEYP